MGVHNMGELYRAHYSPRHPGLLKYYQQKKSPWTPESNLRFCALMRLVLIQAQLSKIHNLAHKKKRNRTTMAIRRIREDFLLDGINQGISGREAVQYSKLLRLSPASNGDKGA